MKFAFLLMSKTSAVACRSRYRYTQVTIIDTRTWSKLVQLKLDTTDNM